MDTLFPLQAWPNSLLFALLLPVPKGAQGGTHSSATYLVAHWGLVCNT
jgi:hypothetical protein